ncbi:DUF6415 family natural product biosynthesis protein [Streptomyces sp. UNOC14_S4]|uniref:DUF6415 family natural product biosynthesis protein n=1 Tax=Streptomyces sp. UNOC14_S4 TaxID=2872340 RepID=UPI001E649565|nr:DUF6415 family natural product biosynthesis protein [Streptomyces sp. UNOC14_S4]MCC3767640.1 hypothetical protein [Streptomyces sp. UNOC14_S4]
MPVGGRHLDTQPVRSQYAEIEHIIGLVLGAAGSPPAGVVEASTLKLRRCIDTLAPRVTHDARELLLPGDPRRTAVEEVADEAVHRARNVGPGCGLESAFAYCRGLARSVRELRDLQRALARVRDDGR